MNEPHDLTGQDPQISSTDPASGLNGLPTLSRRGFIVLSAAMGSSCSLVSSAKPDATAAAPASALPPSATPTRTAPNTQYRTPRPKGPTPRNPDMNLPAGGASSGVTFSRVSVSQPYIALTFDDGPHPKNTPRLLDMLRERNVKATFYVIGRNVDLYPTVLRRTVSEGHEIGNHTYSHPILSKLGDSQVRQELTKCRDAVARAAGVQPRTMRPPYGALLQRQREWVRSELGYPTIMWSVDPLDWKRPGASVVTSRILSGTTPGAIVLAHDLHASTVDAMPATLDGLLNKGFRFVTVSQLLALGAAGGGAVAAGQ